eukprot:6459515-Amphidinium_carterae.1
MAVGSNAIGTHCLHGHPVTCSTLSLAPSPEQLSPHRPALHHRVHVPLEEDLYGFEQARVFVFVEVKIMMQEVHGVDEMHLVAVLDSLLVTPSATVQSGR